MDKVYEWIRNIVVYMILNTIIMNLLANSSYKKYIKIISGMILVLIVIAPLMNIMELNDTIDFYLASNNLAVETSEFEFRLKLIEEAQINEFFGEYKVKLEESAKDILAEEGLYLKNFDIVFDQKEQSNTFGQIIGMEIDLSMEEHLDEQVAEVFRVETIEINRIAISKEEENADKQPPSPLEIKLKNKLSDFYNIEPDNINISIQGG
ncbi:MAG: stage III sporulation protein AF [Clostridiales bacterium]|nr:stage III sporulation protein AF [Clostridiales bacterium]